MKKNYPFGIWLEKKKYQDDEEIKEMLESLEIKDYEKTDFFLKGYFCRLSDLFSYGIADMDEVLIQFCNDFTPVAYHLTANVYPQHTKEVNERILMIADESGEYEIIKTDWQIANMVRGSERNLTDWDALEETLKELKKNKDTTIKRHATGLLEALKL